MKHFKKRVSVRGGKVSRPVKYTLIALACVAVVGLAVGLPLYFTSKKHTKTPAKPTAGYVCVPGEKTCKYVSDGATWATQEECKCWKCSGFETCVFVDKEGDVGDVATEAECKTCAYSCES